MRIYLLFSLILLNILVRYKVVGQDLSNYEIGYYFGLNQEIIDGYHDQNFSPEIIFHVHYNSFFPGHYYDLDGVKIVGNIKRVNSSKFQFKENIDSKKKKVVKANSCLAYVVGTDSFVVAKNLPDYSNKAFVKVMAKFEKFDFFGFYVGDKNLKIKYFVKKKDSERFFSFGATSKEFGRSVSPFFDAYPFLQKKILYGKYKRSDLPFFIKILEYKVKADKNEKIYFSKSWEEVENTEEFEYYANVKMPNDSLWILEHFHKTNYPLFTTTHFSFSEKVIETQTKGPLFSESVPAGFYQTTIEWYYPSGQKRKEQIYRNGKAHQGMKTYHSNGNLHYQCQLSSYDGRWTFNEVKSEAGNDVLDETGSGIEVFIDPVRNLETTRVFERNRMVYAFYDTPEYNSKVIYQYFPEVRLRKPINFQLEIIDNIKYPISSVENFTEGIVLVRLTVDPEGEVIETEIIKGLDNEIDSQVASFFEPGFINSQKFISKGKVEKQKIYQEIIIPVRYHLYKPKDNKYDWMLNFDPFFFTPPVYQNIIDITLSIPMPKL